MDAIAEIDFIKDNYNILIDVEEINQFENGYDEGFTYTGYVFIGGDYDLDFSESYDDRESCLIQTINKVRKYLNLEEL